MKPIKTIVASRTNKTTIDYSSNNKDTDIRTKQISIYQANNIISHVADLIDDKAYEPFFFKQLYRLAPTEFLRRADQARKADVLEHGRLFSKLLSQ